MSGKHEHSTTIFFMKVNFWFKTQRPYCTQKPQIQYSPWQSVKGHVPAGISNGDTTPQMKDATTFKRSLSPENGWHYPNARRPSQFPNYKVWHSLLPGFLTMYNSTSCNLVSIFTIKIFSGISFCAFISSVSCTIALSNIYWEPVVMCTGNLPRNTILRTDMSN